MNTVQINQHLVVMQVIEEAVAKHGLAVLLKEKPFAGINGLGKHNNWSFSTAATMSYATSAALMPSNTAGMSAWSPFPPPPTRRTPARPPSPCPTPSARP